MPSGLKQDPGTNFHFYVDIENVFQGVFREISGIGSENPVIERSAGGRSGETVYTKQPGRTKYNDITFKAGLSEDTLKLTRWREKIELGKIEEARTNGTIWMYNQQNSPMAKWRFLNAWPSKLSGPSMNAGSNETAIEELTLAVEKISREL